MLVSNVSISCTQDKSVWCLTDSNGHREEKLDHNLTPTGHLVVAICLGFIGTLGLFNNSLVLVLFCRYKVLRSPINLLLMNISVSDLLVCVVGTPFSFAASTQRRWLIGKTGCIWYGFINSFLGTVSLISLAVLSYERYCTMMGSTEADETNYRKIGFGILVSWSYSLFWTLPPLFGWSSYGPEGPGTTCSVNWHADNANNISYIICLFIFCLVLPFLVIVYSYGRLLYAIKQVRRINTGVAHTREQRVLLMVMAMVICFLMCWLPYGTVALIATFGSPGLITPEASIIPSLLAKSSTVVNPIIYIFMNKQFYRCFRAFLTCQDPSSTPSTKNSSKSTKVCRRIQENNFSHLVASVGHASTVPKKRTVQLAEGASASCATKQVLSLVVHYRE
ncbi:teleost multiple tissue opsin b [Erpetoichthys calabaricus]|uniref:Teleost multiple tissue opsin b n=1 Tax=Erpetoichthys calabaricus TaxID=27687 RepID=A0A8C4S8F5_ERPCA|nr:teleost multiple tissue opsin b [Erpetoichthys calabaricus]